jgi:hypothetical protein
VASRVEIIGRAMILEIQSVHICKKLRTEDTKLLFSTYQMDLLTILGFHVLSVPRPVVSIAQAFTLKRT